MALNPTSDEEYLGNDAGEFFIVLYQVLCYAMGLASMAAYPFVAYLVLYHSRLVEQTVTFLNGCGLRFRVTRLM